MYSLITHIFVSEALLPFVHNPRSCSLACSDSSLTINSPQFSSSPRSTRPMITLAPAYPILGLGLWSSQLQVLLLTNLPRHLLVL